MFNVNVNKRSGNDVMQNEQLNIFFILIKVLLFYWLPSLTVLLFSFMSFFVDILYSFGHQVLSVWVNFCSFLEVLAAAIWGFLAHTVLQWLPCLLPFSLHTGTGSDSSMSRSHSQIPILLRKRSALHYMNFNLLKKNIHFSSVQSFRRVWLFATPWTAARQASLSITNSQSLPKPMSIE